MPESTQQSVDAGRKTGLLLCLRLWRLEETGAIGATIVDVSDGRQQAYALESLWVALYLSYSIYSNVFWLYLFLYYRPVSEPDSVPPKSRGRAQSERGEQRQRPYKSRQSTRGKENRGKNSIKGGGNGNGNGNGSGSGSIVSRSKQRRGAGSNGDDRYLACPCFKYNPIQNLNCLARNNLTATSFVVQHLERAHKRQPIHCPVCGDTFDSHDSRNGHIRQQSCQQQTFSYSGLSEDQVIQLRQNRNNLNEVDRWYAIWDILYPDVTHPDTPYVGSLLDEISNIFRRALLAHSRRFHLEGNRIAEFLQLPGQLLYDAIEIARLTESLQSQWSSWSYIQSIIPRGEDNLSYLASDNVPLPDILRSPPLPLRPTPPTQLPPQQGLSPPITGFEHLAQVGETARTGEDDWQDVNSRASWSTTDLALPNITESLNGFNHRHVIINPLSTDQAAFSTVLIDAPSDAPSSAARSSNEASGEQLPDDNIPR